MNDIKEAFKICVYEFRIQCTSKRVWLGYLLGIVIILKQTYGYLLYADNIGNSVNVLEAFIVAGNNYNTAMFLVLGWLLVISEAPFINNNSFYLMSRTNKKRWNTAMLNYIFLQAVVYFGFIAFTTIVFSARNGFIANIWSSSLIQLTESTDIAASFNVYFPYKTFIKSISVFQAFGYTWGFGFLYGFVLGIILYVFSLFSKHIAGVTATLLFHFVGYEMMKEGYMVIIKYSLLARSVPVLQIGEDFGVSVGSSLFVYFVIIIILTAISGRIIKFTDFIEAAKGEKE